MTTVGLTSSSALGPDCGVKPALSSWARLIVIGSQTSEEMALTENESPPVKVIGLPFAELLNVTPS